MWYMKGGFAPHFMYAARLCCYGNGGSSNVLHLTLCMQQDCAAMGMVAPAMFEQLHKC